MTIVDFSKALDVQVAHERYDQVSANVQELIELAEDRRGSIIPLLGPTRCGKSELLKDLQEQLQTVAAPTGHLFPSSDFGISTIPPKPNDRELYRSMLTAIGLSFHGKETTALVRDRLLKAVRDQGIKFIALDECSHCAERGANLSARGATDHFKTFVDETGVTLILAGLPKFQHLIDGNEQFRDRAFRTVQFLPYNWGSEKDHLGFVGAVLASLQILQAEGVSIDFDDLDMSRRLYGISGGRVGRVLDVLRAAAKRVQNSTLTFDTVARAARLTIQDSGHTDIYFQDAAPTDESLVRSYARVMHDAELAIDPTNLVEFAAMKAS